MLSQAVFDREPVFIDLETRSACDLRKAGGWNYAAHPTTHLLTVTWSPAPNEYHVWFPWHDEGTIRGDYIKVQNTTNAAVHFGPECPHELSGAAGRFWAAHNAWNFDQLVWESLTHRAGLPTPAGWLDTEPLARAAALPGGLDAIGKRLWGEGKYKAAKPALKKYMTAAAYGDAADVPAGVMPMLAEYNVQDVVLLRGVWAEVAATVRMPQSEWDVLAAHRAINHRGAPVDVELLNALVDLTEEGRVHAVERIAELTDGQGKKALRTINDLQSRNKVFDWLGAIGVSVGSSLRKELIQQFIDKNQSADDDSVSGEDDDSFDAAGDEESVDPTAAREQAERTLLAVRVLQLRGSALRITGGKLASASAAVCLDGRIRGLFVYAGAHTFRWAGRRVQVQNLPRPKDGVRTWELLDAYDASRFVCHRPCLSYATVDAMLPDRSDKRYRYLTPDDAASGLLRGLFTPPEAVGWRDEADPVGCLAADLAGIEARVLGKMAGELGLMKTIWDGSDLYIPMAEVMFGPWQKWPGVDPADYKTAKKHAYRQAGKIVRLGAGYQLGGRQMDVYAAANGIDLAGQGTSGPEAVLAYRRFHPAIAGDERMFVRKEDGKEFIYFRDGWWDKLNEAAVHACQYPETPFTVQAPGSWPVTFVKEGPHLMVYLPSGRRLIYRKAVVKDIQPKFLVGTDRYLAAVCFQPTRFDEQSMYGGKWAENIVQAVSRDFLAFSLGLLERAGFPGILHVHDEAVAAPCRFSRLPEFMSIMTTTPGWATDFPLDAEGGWMPRYSKSPPPGDRFKEVVYRNGKYLKQA